MDIRILYDFLDVFWPYGAMLPFIFCVFKITRHLDLVGLTVESQIDSLVTSIEDVNNQLGNMDSTLENGVTQLEALGSVNDDLKNGINSLNENAEALTQEALNIQTELYKARTA